MSESEQKEHKNKYEFTVDGKEFVSEIPTLTGGQIKARASVDPTFGLFLEGRHGHPDKQIRDDEIVELAKDDKDEFYTMPPATFGTSDSAAP